MKPLSEFTPEFQDAARYYQSQNRPKDQELLVEFLRETQDIYGCITEEAKEQVADIMAVSPAVIDALIRLYPSLHAQRFETKILVCSGSSCLSRQSGALLKSLEKRLGIRCGQVTPDGKYLLCTQPCFKQCGKGPNVKVGDKMYHGVTVEMLEGIL